MDRTGNIVTPKVSVPTKPPVLQPSATNMVAALQTMMAATQAKIDSGEKQSRRKTEQLQMQLQAYQDQIATLADKVREEERLQTIAQLHEANASVASSAQAADQAIVAHQELVEHQHGVVAHLKTLLDGAEGGVLVPAVAQGKTAELLNARDSVARLSSENQALAAENAALVKVNETPKAPAVPSPASDADEALRKEFEELNTKYIAAVRERDENQQIAAEEIAKAKYKDETAKLEKERLQGELETANEEIKNYQKEHTFTEEAARKLNTLKVNIRKAQQTYLATAVQNANWRKVPQNIKDLVADFIEQIDGLAA